MLHSHLPCSMNVGSTTISNDIRCTGPRVMFVSCAVLLIVNRDGKGLTGVIYT